MKCIACKVGPGKFEGEPALAALAYASANLGLADASGEGWEWFKAPFNFDADKETVEFAKATGYCEKCIEEATEEREAKSLTLWESNDGFIHIELDQECPDDEDGDAATATGMYDHDDSN